MGWTWHWGLEESWFLSLHTLQSMTPLFLRILLFDGHSYIHVTVISMLNHSYIKYLLRYFAMETTFWQNNMSVFKHIHIHKYFVNECTGLYRNTHNKGPCLSYCSDFFSDILFYTENSGKLINWFNIQLFFHCQQTSPSSCYFSLSFSFNIANASKQSIIKANKYVWAFLELREMEFVAETTETHWIFWLRRAGSRAKISMSTFVSCLNHCRTEPVLINTTTVANRMNIKMLQRLSKIYFKWVVENTLYNRYCVWGNTRNEYPITKYASWIWFFF